jgi:hypothetical protein
MSDLLGYILSHEDAFRKYASAALIFFKIFIFFKFLLSRFELSEIDYPLYTPTLPYRKTQTPMDTL